MYTIQCIDPIFNPLNQHAIALMQLTANTSTSYLLPNTVLPLDQEIYMSVFVVM